MPAKRKTRADRVAEKFGEMYRIGKARADMTEDDVAHVIGFASRPALLRRRRNPLEFTLGQILTLGAVFKWTDEDYLSFINSGK